MWNRIQLYIPTNCTNNVSNGFNYIVDFKIIVYLEKLDQSVLGIISDINLQ